LDITVLLEVQVRRNIHALQVHLVHQHHKQTLLAVVFAPQGDMVVKMKQARRVQVFAAKAFIALKVQQMQQLTSASQAPTVLLILAKKYCAVQEPGRTKLQHLLTPLVHCARTVTRHHLKELIQI